MRSIHGICVGTGFAMVENLYFCEWFRMNPLLGPWLVRGFGTAVMHGGATGDLRGPGQDAPGASGMRTVSGSGRSHGSPCGRSSFGFNHLSLGRSSRPPAILVVLPPLIFLVFEHSETAVGGVVEAGFDADTEVLEMILSGTLSASPVGRTCGR